MLNLVKHAVRSIFGKKLRTLLTVAGIVVGVEALGGVLLGVIASGTLMAMIMANAGGALFNAKRHIECGNCGGKKSKAYRSSSVGEGAGNPFKDAAGPSINVLIKLVMIVSVVLADVFVRIGGVI